jgi:hypothetical protein
MNRNIRKTKIFAIILIVLLALNIFNTVNADEIEEDIDEIVDDTLEPQGLSARFVSLGISPRKINIKETSKITFKVEFTPSFIYLNTDWKVVVRDGNTVLKTFPGTYKKSQNTVQEFSYTIGKDLTTTEGTETYSLKLYVDKWGSFELRETRTVTLTIVDNTPVSTVSINSFTISPSTVSSGSDVKGSITVSSKNLKLSNYFLTVVLRDTTNNKNIKSYVTILSGSKPTSTFPVSLDLGSSVGKIDIKAEIRIVLPLTTITTKTRTASVTITSPGPDNPVKSTFPSSGFVNQAVGFSTRVSHPSGLSCQIRYNMGDGTTTSWADSSLIHTHSHTYKKEGNFKVEAQARDTHGTTTSWVTLGTISITTRPADILVSITANPTTIKKGESTRIEWSTSNADSATLNGVSVQLNGHTDVSPSSTTTYVLKATASSGQSNDGQVIVLVEESKTEKTTVSISADETNINAGDIVILTWQSTNAHTVRINGEEVGSSGVMPVSPVTTTTYKIEGEGTGTNYDEKSLTITVTGTPPTDNPPTITLIITSGGKVDSQGNPYIEPGGIGIITWYATNAKNITINNNVVTNDALSGSAPISPPVTTTYEAVAIGDSGEARASATLLVQHTPPPTEKEGINTDTIIIIAIGVIILAIVGYYLYKDNKKKQKEFPHYGYDPHKKDNFISKILKRGKKRKKPVGKKDNFISKILKRGKKRKKPVGKKDNFISKLSNRFSKKKKTTPHYFDDSPYNVSIGHDTYDYDDDYGLNYLDLYRRKKNTRKVNIKNTPRRNKK